MIFFLFFNNLVCPNPGDSNSYTRAELISLADVSDEASWLAKISLLLDEKSIDYLAPDCFTNLTQLKYLSLSGNSLSCLDETIFKDLINLQDLYLDKNQLTTISPSVFDNINNINTIKIYINGNPPALLGKSSAYYCNGKTKCVCYCSQDSENNFKTC